VPEDDSGVLRYVRIEDAGQALPGETAGQPGLALLAGGFGTQVQFVQVHASLGDGIFLSGGTVDLKDILLTDNHGVGLRWIDGWGTFGSGAGGRVQRLIVQQGLSASHALQGANPGDFTPRSHPVIFNATLVGPASGGTGGAGLLLGDGTMATVRNTIVLGAGAAGLDFEEDPCDANAIASRIAVTHSIFSSTTDFAADGDCIDESAYALDPGRANRAVDPTLEGPFNTVTADFRFQPGSQALAGFATPPADGFFDSLEHVGAAGPRFLSGGVHIPWHSGWSTGFTPTP
jgi:hypothetical protein